MGKFKWRCGSQKTSAVATVIEMPREKYVGIVDGVLKTVREIYPTNPDVGELIRDLSHLASTTEQVAWGTWWGRGDQQPDLLCGCPLYQISSPKSQTPDGMSLPFQEQFYERYDEAMEAKFDRHTGIAIIKD